MCGKGEELIGQEHKTDGGVVDGTEEVDCGQIMDGLPGQAKKHTSPFLESKQASL